MRVPYRRMNGRTPFDTPSFAKLRTATQGERILALYAVSVGCWVSASIQSRNVRLPFSIGMLTTQGTV